MGLTPFQWRWNVIRMKADVKGANLSKGTYRNLRFYVGTKWSKGTKGVFPLFAETTRSESASTRWLAKQFSVIAWVWQFNEHKPSWSFKQRQLNQAITITLRLTEHANIFLNTYPVVVFSDLSLQPPLPCTRSQQCFTTATIPSCSAILNISNCHVVVCDVAFTRCE